MSQGLVQGGDRALCVVDPHCLKIDWQTHTRLKALPLPLHQQVVNISKKGFLEAIFYGPIKLTQHLSPYVLTFSQQWGYCKVLFHFILLQLLVQSALKYIGSENLHNCQFQSFCNSKAKGIITYVFFLFFTYIISGGDHGKDGLNYHPAILV